MNESFFHNLSSKYHVPSSKEQEFLVERAAALRQSLKTIRQMKKEVKTREQIERAHRLLRDTERDPSDLMLDFVNYALEQKQLHEFLSSQKAQNPALTDEELALRYCWFCVSQGKFPRSFELCAATEWELEEVKRWIGEDLEPVESSRVYERRNGKN